MDHLKYSKLSLSLRFDIPLGWPGHIECDTINKNNFLGSRELLAFIYDDSDLKLEAKLAFYEGVVDFSLCKIYI